MCYNLSAVPTAFFFDNFFLTIAILYIYAIIKIMTDVWKVKKRLFGLAALVGGFSLISGVNAAPVDDVYNDLVKDGTFNVPIVEPTAEEKDTFFEFVVNSYIMSRYDKFHSGFLTNCTENYECDLELGVVNEKFEVLGSRTDKVKVVWSEKDPAIKSNVDSYMEKIKSTMITDESGSYQSKGFELIDLELINGLYHSKNGELAAEQGLSYSKEFNTLLDNSSLTYVLDCRLGDGAPFYGMGGGSLSLWYDGVAYASLLSGHIGVANNYVLYIPESTENTVDAYIAAAKARIDAYLGKNDVKVELAGKIDDIEGIEDGYIKIDKNKTGESYYKITINNKSHDFLIMKNTDISIPVTETKDITTNISIKTTSPEVPLDTKVTVNEIKREEPIFKKFVETIKKEVVKAFDISLHSNTVGNITKLEKGVFEVRLPLGLEYVGRKLSAYYVKDDGSLEEHPITLDAEGNAVFETTHFSTYFIADASNKVTEEVPKTFDKADIYIMLAISGAIGLFASIVFFRTKTN